MTYQRLKRAMGLLASDFSCHRVAIGMSDCSRMRARGMKTIERMDGPLESSSIGNMECDFD